MFKLQEVISYASRPKREDEVEGREHYFISREEAEKMIKQNNVHIKTEINGVIYFATDEEIKEKNIYKIDPKTLNDLKTYFSDLNIKVIYIWASEELRRKRAKKRKDISFNKRNADEDEQFNIFEKEDVDLTVNNSSNPEITTGIILGYIEEHPADLYCIVGRTCSGKDTIIKRLLEMY